MALERPVALARAVGGNSVPMLLVLLALLLLAVAKTGTRLAPDQLRTMARDQVLAASAAIRSLDGGAFVTLHSRVDRGRALPARKLANGAVQLYWRYALGADSPGHSSSQPAGRSQRIRSR